MKRRFLAVACAGLVLGGCGGGRGATSPPEATGSTLPSLSAPQPAPSSPAITAAPGERATDALPQVTVDDVGAGTKVDLASLSPSSQPLLVWLWAPH